MVTNAGSKPAANSDRSHTRVISEGTSQRLPDIANSGLPPESRPGTVRLIRHTWKGRETSGREGNTGRNQLEAEHRPWPSAAGPGAAGCISAPRARKHGSASSGRAPPQPKANVPACRTAPITTVAYYCRYIAIPRTEQFRGSESTDPLHRRHRRRRGRGHRPVRPRRRGLWNRPERRAHQRTAHGAGEYIDHARKAGGASRRAPRSRAASATDTTAVRTWAREQGIDIKDRGRVPAGIVAKYQAATGR